MHRGYDYPTSFCNTFVIAFRAWWAHDGRMETTTVVVSIGAGGAPNALHLWEDVAAAVNEWSTVIYCTPSFDWVTSGTQSGSWIDPVTGYRVEESSAVWIVGVSVRYVVALGQKLAGLAYEHGQDAIGYVVHDPRCGDSYVSAVDPVGRV